MILTIAGGIVLGFVVLANLEAILVLCWYFLKFTFFVSLLTIGVGLLYFLTNT